VLKASDIGYRYIREKDNTLEYEVNNYEIDLKLPFLNSTNTSAEIEGGYIIQTLYGYSRDSSGFKWERITDATVIEKYLAYKNNGVEFSASDLKQTIPTGFSTNWSWSGNKIWPSDVPKDGLYYLWTKISDENCKTIYGYIIHDVLPDATLLGQYLEGIDLDGLYKLQAQL